MLEQIDLSKKMNEKEYNETVSHLEIRLAQLQRKCREQNIPVMIFMEGLEAAGKGTMINRLIRCLDPRGFQVFAMGNEKKADKKYPYFHRFLTKIPARGRIHIFDSSWYQGIRSGQAAEDQVNAVEKMLTEDGMVLCKFFLLISEKEQKNRLEKIRGNKETAWKVSDRAWKEKDQYKEILQAYDTILHDTDRANAPWIIVESMDRRFAVCKIMKELVDRMEMALLEKSQKVFKEAEEEADPMRNSILQGVDLTKSLTPEEYKSKKKKLQKKLAVLQNECYRLKVPVVLAFEGWDAGGKGGAIKRLTQAMDPRGYEVVPVSAPNDLEKSHHYLWRFCNKFPEDGKITIFDRTWYGRVLVERIEGFAREDEWKRAYAEINHMERQLTEHGAVLLKFWMHIDKEEQAVRFEQRQEIPEKQWKITDEDWRNREKWDQYEVAVDEMIVRTSTEQAPWHIIEGNSKLYARIRVMEVVVEALEKKISLLQK